MPVAAVNEDEENDHNSTALEINASPARKVCSATLQAQLDALKKQVAQKDSQTALYRETLDEQRVELKQKDKAIAQFEKQFEKQFATLNFRLAMLEAPRALARDKDTSSAMTVDTALKGDATSSATSAASDTTTRLSRVETVIETLHAMVTTLTQTRKDTRTTRTNLATTGKAPSPPAV